MLEKKLAHINLNHNTFLEEKECPICLDIFKPIRNNQKYCSRKCYNKRKNEANSYYYEKNKIGNLILVTRKYKYYKQNNQNTFLNHAGAFRHKILRSVVSIGKPPRSILKGINK
jgi:hypothetical protein